MSLSLSLDLGRRRTRIDQFQSSSLAAGLSLVSLNPRRRSLNLTQYSFVVIYEAVHASEIFQEERFRHNSVVRNKLEDFEMYVLTTFQVLREFTAAASIRVGVLNESDVAASIHVGVVRHGGVEQQQGLTSLTQCLNHCENQTTWYHDMRP